MWWFEGDEVALFAPVEGWCGEAGVMTASVLECYGGVDELLVGDVMAGGPVVPGGERVKGVGGCFEPGVGRVQVAIAGRSVRSMVRMRCRTSTASPTS